MIRLVYLGLMCLDLMYLDLMYPGSMHLSLPAMVSVTLLLRDRYSGEWIGLYYQ
jgi:hypothetical protein